MQLLQKKKKRKLERLPYGLCQSPRKFLEHLKANLLKAGFTQSSANPCLFISDQVICLVYVDDNLFYSPTKTEIDKTLERLRELEMDLNVEDDVAGFLGVSIRDLTTTKVI